MNELSRVQREAVTHMTGPMMVLAGPGSGKTYVLTRRVRYLTKECGVNPQNILVITFTRAAASEMKERYLRAAGRTRSKVTFGTFHAVFLQILKLAYGYTADNILRETDRYQILREAVYRRKLDPDDESELISAISSEISRVKNSGGISDEYPAASCDSESFLWIYENYQERLKKSGKIDFDDMLIYTYELLTVRKDILSSWQRRFKYILVDEFQDINRLQYDIVRLLAGPENNLFIVGDDDQSIYRFRGSRPEIMLHFEEDYPSAKKVLLDVNYRSTPEITNAAGRLISFNKDRFPKEISAFGESGEQVVLKEFRDQHEEYGFLIEEIKRLCKNDMYGSCAVLYRTNAQPRLLMEELVSGGVPYNCKDDVPDIYDNRIVKDVFAYLHLSQGRMRRSEFMQVMNRPNRYLSRECLENEIVSWEEVASFYRDLPWMCERIETFRRDLAMCKRLPPSGAVHYIRHIIGYEDYLREYAKHHARKPEEFTAVLDELLELARPFGSLSEWEEHIAAVRKETEQSSETSKKHIDGVELCTMHASKGLEYRNVFIIDAVEGVTPHHRSVHDEEIEEERRLFYVAMTRAKERLYILSVRKMRGKKAQKSRFLEELRGLYSDGNK